MFKEIKEKLLEEYNNLSNYYNDCCDKADVLYKNTKKNKIEIIGALTVISIIPVFIAAVSLLEGIPFSSFGMTLFGASITAISVSISYLGQKLIIFNAKKKMKKFTNAKKNREIVKELNIYELEKEKAKKKLEVIYAILDKVESKEKIFDEITRDGKYTITENSLSEEELNKNYELMLQNYNNKMQELDIIVSQEFLSKKFRDYRKKWDRIPTAISNGLVLGLLFSIPTCFGFLGDDLRKQIPAESALDLLKQIFSAFIPALAVSPITIFSTVRSSNDYLYAFNELNNTLGENALKQKPDKKTEENLEKNIEKLTNELIELGYSIKETEHTLKVITKGNVSSETKQRTILFTPYKPLKITEETRRAVLEHPELHSGLSVRVRMGKFYTDDEWEQRREEILNKPLPGDVKKRYTRKRKR